MRTLHLRITPIADGQEIGSILQLEIPTHLVTQFADRERENQIYRLQTENLKLQEWYLQAQRKSRRHGWLYRFLRRIW